MQAIEFETEILGAPALTIPPEIAARMPQNGVARVIVMWEADEEESLWRRASYEQFMREDDPADAVYDNY